MAGLLQDVLIPEKVAYWYFRLNGFFQMDSFIVHPRGRGSQRTDADLLGVRFPYRQEMFFDDPGHTMPDDVDSLKLDGSLTDVVIVEVKRNQPCSLNGPWSNQEKKNVHRVLAAVGCFPISRIEEAAECLYGNGEYLDEASSIRVRLVALGGERSTELTEKYPGVVQTTWKDVLLFIGDRLHEFRSNKKDVSQWEGEITWLQALVAECSRFGEFDQSAFIDEASKRLGLKITA